MVGREDEEGNAPEHSTEHTEHSDVQVLENQPAAPKPPKYAVVLFNDEYTTMEFVVEILQRYFKLSHEEAVKVMLKVHHDGRGVAGIYTYDIAETKANQVMLAAKSRGYPLRCTVEEQ